MLPRVKYTVVNAVAMIACLGLLVHYKNRNDRRKDPVNEEFFMEFEKERYEFEEISEKESGDSETTTKSETPQMTSTLGSTTVLKRHLYLRLTLSNTTTATTTTTTAKSTSTSGPDTTENTTATTSTTTKIPFISDIHQKLRSLSRYSQQFEHDNELQESQLVNAYRTENQFVKCLNMPNDIDEVDLQFYKWCQEDPNITKIDNWPRPTDFSMMDSYLEPTNCSFVETNIASTRKVK